jgi:hypothetical protein
MNFGADGSEQVALVLRKSNVQAVVSVRIASQHLLECALFRFFFLDDHVLCERFTLADLKDNGHVGPVADLLTCRKHVALLVVKSESKLLFGLGGLQDLVSQLEEGLVLMNLELRVLHLALDERNLELYLVGLFVSEDVSKVLRLTIEGFKEDTGCSILTCAKLSSGGEGTGPNCSTKISKF